MIVLKLVKNFLTNNSYVVKLSVFKTNIAFSIDINTMRIVINCDFVTF